MVIVGNEEVGVLNIEYYIQRSRGFRRHNSTKSHSRLSSPIARPLPPPRPFEPDQSSSTPTVSFRALLVVSHSLRVNSSATACVPSPSGLSNPITHLPPRPRLLEPECSSPTSTVSIRARALVSRSDHVFLSPNTRLLPQPCLFEPERSSPASTVSIRAQALVSRPDHVFSSLNTHLPLQPCPLEHNCSPSTPNCVYSSPSARLPPRPCLFKPDHSSTAPPCFFFKPDRLSTAPAMFLRARTLIHCPHHVFF